MGKQLSQFACLGLFLLALMINDLVTRWLTFTLAHWASEFQQFLAREEIYLSQTTRQEFFWTLHYHHLFHNLLLWSTKSVEGKCEGFPLTLILVSLSGAWRLSLWYPLNNFLPEWCFFLGEGVKSDTAVLTLTFRFLPFTLLSHFGGKRF